MQQLVGRRVRISATESFARFEDFPIFHHKRNLLKRQDVFERVSRCRNNISGLSDFDFSPRLFDAEQLG